MFFTLNKVIKNYSTHIYANKHFLTCLLPVDIDHMYSKNQGEKSVNRKKENENHARQTSLNQ